MLATFRIISVIEGLSLLLLFGIAMPAKYYFDNPDLVPVFGMAHGVLWLLYVFVNLLVAQLQKWSVGFWLFSLLMSVLPFGFIALEYQLKPQTAKE